MSNLSKYFINLITKDKKDNTHIDNLNEITKNFDLSAKNLQNYKEKSQIEKHILSELDKQHNINQNFATSFFIYGPDTNQNKNLITNKTNQTFTISLLKLVYVYLLSQKQLNENFILKFLCISIDKGNNITNLIADNNKRHFLDEFYINNKDYNKVTVKYANSFKNMVNEFDLARDNDNKSKTNSIDFNSTILNKYKRQSNPTNIEDIDTDFNVKLYSFNFELQYNNTKRFFQFDFYIVNNINNSELNTFLKRLILDNNNIQNDEFSLEKIIYRNIPQYNSINFLLNIDAESKDLENYLNITNNIKQILSKGKHIAPKINNISKLKEEKDKLKLIDKTFELYQNLFKDVENLTREVESIKKVLNISDNKIEKKKINKTNKLSNNIAIKQPESQLKERSISKTSKQLKSIVIKSSNKTLSNLSTKKLVKIVNKKENKLNITNIVKELEFNTQKLEKMQIETKSIQESNKKAINFLKAT